MLAFEIQTDLNVQKICLSKAEASIESGDTDFVRRTTEEMRSKKFPLIERKIQKLMALTKDAMQKWEELKRCHQSLINKYAVQVHHHSLNKEEKELIGYRLMIQRFRLNQYEQKLQRQIRCVERLFGQNETTSE